MNDHKQPGDSLFLKAILKLVSQQMLYLQVNNELPWQRTDTVSQGAAKSQFPKQKDITASHGSAPSSSVYHRF